MNKLAFIIFALCLTTFGALQRAEAQCCGDCNFTGMVNIADLITAVRAYEANLSVQTNFEKMAERAMQSSR